LGCFPTPLRAERPAAGTCGRDPAGGGKKRLTPRRQEREALPSFSQGQLIIASIEAFIGLVAVIYTWRRWVSTRIRPDAKARWEKVRQIMVDEDKGEVRQDAN
jgi:hypothetical protein